MPEITTKEILKRYGDLAKHPTLHSSTAAGAADAAPIRSPLSASHTSQPAVSVATRIEPASDRQATAWQKESSVRPVQQPTNGTGPYAHGNQSSSAQQLPPPDFGGGNYHVRAGSASSLPGSEAGGRGTPNRQSQRWGKGGPTGAVG